MSRELHSRRCIELAYATFEGMPHAIAQRQAHGLLAEGIEQQRKGRHDVVVGECRFRNSWEFKVEVLNMSV